MVGDLTVDHENVFKTLLQLDVVRGKHSTGVCSVAPNGDFGLVKTVGSPCNLFDTKSFDMAMRGKNNALMGHNRYATVGSVNAANAHPFEAGSVIGAHNGTLKRKALLDDALDYHTDSEAIFHNIDIHGIEKTLGMLDGAYALSWYDSADKTINLIRNSERDLYYSYSDDNKAVYWSSEEWMSYVATTRSGKKALYCQKMMMLAPNIQIKIRIPTQGEKVVDMRNNVTIINQKEHAFKPYVYAVNHVVKKPEPLTPLPIKGQVVEFEPTYEGCYNTVWYFAGNVGGFGSPSMRVYTERESEIMQRVMNPANKGKRYAITIKEVKNMKGWSYLVGDKRTLVEVVKEEPEGGNRADEKKLLGYNNVAITEAEFNASTKKGCAWCSDSTEVEESHELHWLARDEFICGACQDFEDVQQFLNIEFNDY
jgi:hypothetical protein